MRIPTKGSSTFSSGVDHGPTTSSFRTSGCHWRKRAVSIFSAPFLGISQTKCNKSSFYRLLRGRRLGTRSLTVRWLFSLHFRTSQAYYWYISPRPLIFFSIFLCMYLLYLLFHSGVSCRYVQHRMDEQRLLLRRLLIDQQASVFVAGNAKQMPDQVTQALRSALMNEDGATSDGWSIDKAQSYITEMMKQSRLQMETWS